MINFLKETLDVLSEYNKTPSDVLWVGHINQNVKNTWEWFEKNADFLYDNGYGGNEIPMSMVIVGKDFWLERHEYDGSEWWEFKSLPQEPERVAEFKMKAMSWKERFAKNYD